MAKIYRKLESFLLNRPPSKNKISWWDLLYWIVQHGLILHPKSRRSPLVPQTTTYVASKKESGRINLQFESPKDRANAINSNVIFHAISIVTISQYLELTIGTFDDGFLY